MLTMPRDEVIRRLPRLLVGLVIFGVGVALQVQATLGLAAWDVLHQGLSELLPGSIGIWTIIISGAVLLLWIPLRQRVGIGTIANAIVIGVVVDLTINFVDEPTNLIVRWAFLLGGILLVGLGSGMYIGVRLGPGPRDGLMTGLATRKIQGYSLSIRVARTIVEGGALIIGFLLGGTVGIGTVVFTVLIGPIVQFFLERFDMGFHETGIIPAPKRMD